MRLTERKFRTTEKSGKPVSVDCALRDCVFHEGPSAYPGHSMCSHPHKHQHLVGNCPLYHLDWVKQTQAKR